MDRALKISPKNLFSDWGDFEDWEAGDSAAPTGWTKTSTPTVAKESTIKKFGSYALKMVGGGSGQSVYRALPSGTDYQGRTISLGCWVYTSGAGVTLTISDGVGSANSSAHTGGGGWEFLSVTRKIDVAATKVQADLNIPNGVTAYYDGCVLVEDETIFTYLESATAHVDTWKPSIGIKNQRFSIARRSGIYIPEITMEGRTINIKGYVAGDTLSDARTNLDNLVKALLSARDDEQREIYLYDDRVMEAFLDDLDWDYVAKLKVAQYNLKFLAQEPSVRYISKLRKKEVIASSPTEFNFAYNGNIRSKPIIYFIADQSVAITSCKLENLTTGESFSFTGTVAAGETLKVDCETFEVLNDTDDGLANFLGDFLKLVKGTNYLKYTGSLCTIKIDWFDRWLTG